MDNKSRRDAMIVVWVVAGLMGIAYPFYLQFAITTALITTIILWAWVFIKPIRDRLFTPTSQKAPYTEVNTTAYKLAILMEMMDEDERQDFKYQLKNNLLSGDESVSLESMVSEKRKRR